MGSNSFYPWVRGWLSQVTTRRRIWEGVTDSAWVKAQLSEGGDIILSAQMGGLSAGKLSVVGEGRVGQLTWGQTVTSSPRWCRWCRGEGLISARGGAGGARRLPPS